jgi:hypothetical protein
VYEIVQRHFADLPGQARPIGRGEARRLLVLRYLDNVVAADRKMVANFDSSTDQSNSLLPNSLLRLACASHRCQRSFCQVCIARR